MSVAALNALPQSIPQNIQSSDQISIEIKALPSYEASSSTFQRDSLGLHLLDYVFISKDQKALQSLFQNNRTQFNFKFPPKIKKVVHDIRDVSTRGIWASVSKSLIHKFVYTGKVDIVSSFLGTNLYTFDLQPENGLTCMHLAAMGNSTQMIELLKTHDFEIDSLDIWGRTPLHYATLNPNKEILLALLKYQGNLTLKDSFGISPLDLLNYESQVVNPLNISDSQTDATTFLMTSLIIDFFAQQLRHQETPILDLTASLFTYLSQIVLMRQNKSNTPKEILVATALYALAQQFTLTKFATNVYLLAKVSSAAFKSLVTAYRFGECNPTDCLKVIGINALQTALVAQKLLSIFPLSTIDNYLLDLERSYSFGESKMDKSFIKNGEIIQV